jgi:short-subunit dehydrogenase
MACDRPRGSLGSRYMTLPPPSPESIAVVTGASSGIGEQFARQLVARGYRVVVTARRADRLQTLCTDLGGEAHAVAVGADLAMPQDRERLATRIDELGQVDLLVNSAGFGIYRRFGAEGRDKELQMLRVDVEAVVDLMLRYLPGMVDRGRGAIINVSSVSAFQPAPYNAGYAAAKAYVLWLSEAVHARCRRSSRRSTTPTISSTGCRRSPRFPPSGWSPTPWRPLSVAARL